MPQSNTPDPLPLNLAEAASRACARCQGSGANPATWVISVDLNGHRTSFDWKVTSCPCTGFEIERRGGGRFETAGTREEREALARQWAMSVFVPLGPLE